MTDVSLSATEHKPRVLVVDDESGPRESLKMLLKPEFEVTATACGSEALRLLHAGEFEVVLLDLTMPEDLSGTETLRAIRASNVDVEAIVVTGQGTLDTAVECLRLGARDYIAKPYRAGAVVSAVRSSLASRAARRRAVHIREHFLGNLSHEFRTPLNAIVGCSEILHDEVADRLTHEGRWALDRIHSHSEHLLSFLEGLLFLADLHAGDLALRPREFEVRPWLDRLLQPIRREAADSAGSPSLECEPGLVAYADPEALGRLMSVLIAEARTAAARGRIRVAAKPDRPGGIDLFVEFPPAEDSGSPAAGGGWPLEGRTGGPSSERFAAEVIDRGAQALDAFIATRMLASGSIQVHVAVGGALPLPGVGHRRGGTPQAPMA